MAKKLTSNVYVGGKWYGPSYGNADQVPADVAEQITNPGAWESGESPAGEPAARSDEPGGSPSQPDREALEGRAKELGVTFRANISDETLAERVYEAEAKTDED